MRIYSHIPLKFLRLLLVMSMITHGLSGVMRAEESPAPASTTRYAFEWQKLAEYPAELGVAGPYVGVDHDALIIAGGAYYPAPVWDNSKVWSDAIHVLIQSPSGYEWREGGKLAHPVAYGAAVSTPHGVLCMGGNDAEQVYDDVTLLRWDPVPQKITPQSLPRLPKPCVYGQATLIGNVVYFAGGQSDKSLDSALRNFWKIDLTNIRDTDKLKWEELPPCPGPSRSFNLTVTQHNGYDNCIYVMSGRRQNGDAIEFLKDVWEYTPRTNQWRQRASAPRCIMTASAMDYGQSHIFVMGGDEGTLFSQTDVLRDQHPGFKHEILAYHTITDSWTLAGEMPETQVTTIPVKWHNKIVIPVGEEKPRYRSKAIWAMSPVRVKSGFGSLNYIVLFSYLAVVVGIGVYFSQKNANTDDFFRGGKSIPWWAAGCSIFATMLSSVTFTGIPAKAFAQDWVYAVGNLMIPITAFIAVYLALPFYRQLDVTSAYEYLEKRFSRGVRLFGSASFILFHIFRMGVVMSLTAMALEIATPLTALQSVLLMGIMCIIYSSMGGVEAVIWTDTMQTVVLLGGAVVALCLMCAEVNGGIWGAYQFAQESNKFHMLNFHSDVSHTQLAIWVVIFGALGQNISSYTADQSIIQRYMTTSTQAQAARSIWTNAVLTVPSTFLFFGIGSALYVFYRAHPDRIDPTITTDQIFPLFIANEMPAGMAGLIVAGIFSAAQSTLSTSMNSTATSFITDFLPARATQGSAKSGLILAQVITSIMGILGTILALSFISPHIRSLFETSIMVVGLFMGVLGGLFLLGVLTRRANSFGAFMGSIIGASVMFYLWKYTTVNGYLYTTIGIATCFISGYLLSFLYGGQHPHLAGLTIYDKLTAPTTPEHSMPQA